LKKSELRKLISDYNLIKSKSTKHDVSQKLKEIERRFFHETGREIFDEIK